MNGARIRELAVLAGIDMSLYDMGAASCVFTEGCHGVARAEFEKFIELLLADALGPASEAMVKVAIHCTDDEQCVYRHQPLKKDGSVRCHSCFEECEFTWTAMAQARSKELEG